MGEGLTNQSTGAKCAAFLVSKPAPWFRREKAENELGKVFPVFESKRFH